MKRLLIIIFGIVALGIGIFIIVNGNNLAKVCTEETTGKVVGILREEETDSDGYTSIVYSPQIEYTVDEKLVTVKGNGSSNASDIKVGEEIQIMYNPANVEQYMIKGDNSSMVGGIIWIVLGAIIILIGIFKLLTGK
mgnify:CR=1 FL=1